MIRTSFAPFPWYTTTPNFDFRPSFRVEYIHRTAARCTIPVSLLTWISCQKSISSSVMAGLATRDGKSERGWWPVSFRVGEKDYALENQDLGRLNNASGKRVSVGKNRCVGG
jgi:hypothetical protein